MEEKKDRTTEGNIPQQGEDLSEQDKEILAEIDREDMDEMDKKAQDALGAVPAPGASFCLPGLRPRWHVSCLYKLQQERR